MLESSKIQEKPYLYQGKKIPINELSPDDFEKFMYGVLKVIFYKFKFIGQPGKSGDGGFDIDAKNENGKIICFQCKRYPDTELDLKKVAKELSKVALRSYIEGSEIIEHYIITSGKVKNEVDSARRNSSRKLFIEYAINEAKNENNCKHDKDLILKKDPHVKFDQIVTAYIEKLQTIFVWNSGQLDSEIGSVYSNINDLLERFFHIQTTLREYPRPDFNENIYLTKFSDERRYITLTYFNSKPSANFYSTTKSDNFLNDNNIQSNDSVFKIQKPNYCDLISDERPFVLLVSDGGTGKTTTCKQIFNYYADKRKNDKEIELPIYLSFDKCGENLNATINQELNVKYGDWQSIPGKFLLIFDGLNEIDQFKRKDLLDQIYKIINNSPGRIKLLITTRNISAYNTVIILPFIDPKSYFGIQKLSDEQIEDLLNINFDITEKRNFIKDLKRKGNNLNQFFIQQPFGLQLLISLYKSYKSIPNTIDQVILKYYKTRYERNKEFFISRNIDIENLPYSSFLIFIENLAFLWRIKYNKHQILLENTYSIIIEALEIVKDQKAFGFSNLSESEIFELSIKTEFLICENNYLYFQHDIIADFFASKQFAASWSEDFILKEEPSKEFLYFTSSYIKKDKLKFIEIIKKLSISLMAYCSCQMGQEIIDYTENYLDQNLQLNDEFSAITFLSAYSIIRTPKLKERLKNLLIQTHGNFGFNYNINYQIKRFLCIMGDEDTLNNIIKDVESMRLIPGKVSGGSIYLWEISDPQAKIDLSRKRLIANEKDCLASIETLCYLNSKEDIKLIINVIKQSDHPIILMHGLYALYYLEPRVALDIIDEYVDAYSSPIDKLFFLKIRYNLKSPVKIDWVIDFLAHYKEIDNNSTALDDAERMLFSVELNNKHIEQLESLIEKKDKINKYEIYRVIAHHKLALFYKRFIEILEYSVDEQEIFCILKYFRALGVKKDISSKYESIICKLYEKYKTSISAPLYREIVYSFSKMEINNTVLSDLKDEFENDINTYNLYSTYTIDPFNKSDETMDILNKKYIQEHKIFNYILCFSYISNENTANFMLSKLFRLYKLPEFNRDTQKEAFKGMLELVSDYEIESLFSITKLELEDQLLIIEIVASSRISYEFKLKKFNEFLDYFFEKERPDKLITIMEIIWSKDVFSAVITKLKLFGLEHKAEFERIFSRSFFNDFNSFIINKIIYSDNEVEISPIMPISFDYNIHQKLKDIFLFWNYCFKQRKYIF